MTQLSDEPWKVLPEGSGETMMQGYLMGRAKAAFERRREAYEAIQTAKDLKAYQARLREFFLARLGAFPERTPLNAKIVGRIEREDYCLEKVLFESQPAHSVTGALYLPSGPGPHPAVLVPCGHSANGKGSVAYQRVSILLAKNGIAAFCYDPIGQGERYQVLDEEGCPKYKCTMEHSMFGMGCILLGTNTAQYRIFDGMRALDYLESRDDVDSGRLGCTGNSGGGTVTSYLMALDERIQCASPSCYLTTMERLMETRGPQDAEQNIYGQIEAGMDHADYVLMRAPLPILMCTTTHDMFAIDGAWDTFRQAKRMYTRLGFAERVDLVEVDGPHGLQLLQREAIVRWMRRWLSGVDEVVTEPDFEVFTDEELQCSPEGQVMRMDGARSSFAINLELDDGYAAGRPAFSAEEARGRVGEVLGLPEGLPEGDCRTVEVVEREDCRVEKLLIETEPGIQVSALAFVPKERGPLAYLYAHGEGKSVDADGAIADLVRQGHLVLSVDVRGCGETRPESSVKSAFFAYLLELSYLGMRTLDLLVCARLLGRYGGQDYGVGLIGVGEVGTAALHAAVLEPGLIASLTLRDAPGSWRNLLETPDAPLDLLPQTVHGALKIYDLPDLLALLSEDRVEVEGLFDPAGIVK